MQTFIRFTVSGEPIGKARPRFTRNGRPYTPKKTADYESQIRNAFLSAGGKSACCNPVRVTIYCFQKIPTQTPKWKKRAMLSGIEMPTKRPDVDNVSKAVLDSLNGVAYNDDCQVVQLSVYKMYSTEPRIEIIIGYRGIGYTGYDPYLWDTDGLHDAEIEIMEEEEKRIQECLRDLVK